MKKIERQVLHHCFDKAKEFRKLQENDKARDYLDMGIGFCAAKKEDGMNERFWMKLENWNLML